MQLLYDATFLLLQGFLNTAVVASYCRNFRRRVFHITCKCIKIIPCYHIDRFITMSVVVFTVDQIISTTFRNAILVPVAIIAD